MSRTFTLVCDEKKLKLWVGQGPTAGSDRVFFYSDDENRDRLVRFLEATRGSSLELFEDEQMPLESGDYEDFEDH